MRCRAPHRTWKWRGRRCAMRRPTATVAASRRRAPRSATARPTARVPACLSPPSMPGVGRGRPPSCLGAGGGAWRSERSEAAWPGVVWRGVAFAAREAASNDGRASRAGALPPSAHPCRVEVSACRPVRLLMSLLPLLSLSHATRWRSVRPWSPPARAPVAGTGRSRASGRWRSWPGGRPAYGWRGAVGAGRRRRRPHRRRHRHPSPRSFQCRTRWDTARNCWRRSIA